MLNILACFLILISLYFPRLTIGNIWIGVDDLTVLLLGAAIVISRPKRMLVLIKPIAPLIFFFFIFFPVGLIQSASYLGDAGFPTELWQYIKRIIVFLLFSYVAGYQNDKSIEFIRNLFILALLGYQASGIFQLILGDYGDFLSQLYARTEQQLRLAIQDNHFRIFGIAGHSNSWGAFSGFSLFAIFAMYFLKNEPRLRWSLCAIIFFIGVAILCLANVYFSGSRGAMVSVFLAIVYFLFVQALNRPIRFLSFSPLLVGFSAVLVWFVSSNFHFFEFVAYRFVVLIESSGGGRVDQIMQALGLLDFPHEYLFGISSSVQRHFAVSYGVEVEYVNVLVSYGLVGFSFLYFQLVLLWNKFNKGSKLSGQNYFNSAIAAKAMLLMYAVFSLGYFFYAELIVGVLPWAFFGFLYGVFIRQSRSNKVRI